MKLLRYGMMAGIGLILLTFAPIRGDQVIAQTDPSLKAVQKLKSIVVSIDFTRANINEAVEALSNLSKQIDPDHQGINFVVEPVAAASAQPITLKLDEVPLGETLRYVCELGGVHYKIGDRFVTISPMQAGPEFVKRTYYVDPSFVESAASAGVIPTWQTP